MRRWNGSNWRTGGRGSVIRIRDEVITRSGSDGVWFGKVVIGNPVATAPGSDSAVIIILHANRGNHCHRFRVTFPQSH